MRAPLLTSATALAIAMTSFPSFSFAQETPPSEETQDHHDRSNLEEVIVTASPLRRARFDTLQSTAVLTNEQLEEELSGTIGETIDHLPGISNSSFGAGAGRPVIRGLSGDRIRILVGGIGAIDASTTSPDHAVAADPLTSQSIEVIRGPATLLYGNNAVGGVVNILDGRIPFERPEDKIDLVGRIVYGTNANNINFAASGDIELGQNFVFHADGSWRDTADYDVPGFLESAPLRAMEEAEGEVEGHDEEEEELFGTAENSDLRNSSFSTGLSYIGDRGFIGFSITQIDNNYGIPGHAHEEEGEEEHEEGEEGHEEEEGVRIDLAQTRYDLMGQIDDPVSWLQRARIRFGWADYKHVELEGNDIGTTFLNDGYEGRLEFTHTPVGDMEGAFGIQIRHRDFEAIGDEAFVPPNQTTQYGAFLMEEWILNRWTLQAGARIERQKTKAPSIALSRDFTGVSLSGGLSYLITDDLLLGGTIHRTERAPNAEELFSNGPHLATNIFEVGDTTLGEETAFGFEASLRKRGGPFTGSVTVFYEEFDDFIFQTFTGAEMDELPVGLFTATDARFVGFEVETGVELFETNGFTGHANATLDMVRARDTVTDTPLPRIPPISGEFGFEVIHDMGFARAEVDWAGEQTRTATGELPTGSYASVNLTFAYRPFGQSRDILMMAQVRNLLDDDIRYHASYLKDILPQPGRDIRFTIRAGF